SGTGTRGGQRQQGSGTSGNGQQGGQQGGQVGGVPNGVVGGQIGGTPGGVLGGQLGGGPGGSPEGDSNGTPDGISNGTLNGSNQGTQGGTGSQPGEGNQSQTGQGNGTQQGNQGQNGQGGNQGQSGQGGNQGQQQQQQGQQSGARRNALDEIVRVAGYLNLEFGSGQPGEEAGGIPGGMDLFGWRPPMWVRRTLQVAYVALTVITTVIPIGKAALAAKVAIQGALKVGLRATARRLLTALVA